MAVKSMVEEIYVAQALRVEAGVVRVENDFIGLPCPSPSLAGIFRKWL